MTERTRSEHIVFVGPYCAGKTSLMLEVARQSGGQYYVKRNYTDRLPRPGESDAELIFMSRSLFDVSRPLFLTTHSQPRTNYAYGVPTPEFDLARVSMRAMPSDESYVGRFKRLVEAAYPLGRVTVCQIAVSDPALLEERLLARDPNISPDDLENRLASNQTQPDIAGAFCDDQRNDGLTFVNDYPTIGEAGIALLSQLDAHLVVND